MKQPTNFDYNPTNTSPLDLLQSNSSSFSSMGMDQLKGLMNLFTQLPEEMQQQLQQQLSCSWWGLPTSLQDELQKSFTGQQTFELEPYKNPDGTWGFDMPELLTLNEKLLGGTELCLDYYWQKLTGTQPKTGDKMEMKLSSLPFDGYDGFLTFQGDDDLDPGSSYYLDNESQLLCWLCPFLPWLFGNKPQTLYFSLKQKG